MGELSKFHQPKNEDGPGCYVLLMRDGKSICRMQCQAKEPISVPHTCHITDFLKANGNPAVLMLPQFIIVPAYEDKRQKYEWEQFMTFLQKSKKVAFAKTDYCKFYIRPPTENGLTCAIVSYLTTSTPNMCYSQKQIKSESLNGNSRYGSVQPSMEPVNTCLGERLRSPMGELVASNVRMTEEQSSPHHKAQVNFDDRRSSALMVKNTWEAKTCAVVENDPVERNYVRADPSYLKTLGQAHSGWMFGAIAELVDNSRDAKATTLRISIDIIYSKIAGKEIPMLSIIDDGHGMTHEQILRMVAFGHKQPDADDPDHIGRFGVGFKTGAMRLGKDALVLTQAANSRSIAFLSQSLNEGKDNLEIPIVSYCRKGQFMEIDTSVQSEALTRNNLKAIMDFSPFNEYLIGEKAGLFERKGTGTQIYIWNLDEWGSNYCLDWETGMSGGSSFHQGDIIIRSRRNRSRPGQMAPKVPMDYSLRSYLEVIFIDPRMKIFVQGSQVKSRPLAKSLNKTVVENGVIMGKPVQLTLGRSQLEWEQANSGMFLYWHGRLIEAYKRVGGMVHNGDKSHGIIGVIDVTDVMNDGNGRVWVHSNKQGFQDCEVYAVLEEWLGAKADEYLDNNFDKIEVKKGGSLYKPDYEWVQCDKCRKWRILRPGFDSKMLPQEWFCYMKPFNGKCEMPEQKEERGVITVSSKRSGYDISATGASPLEKASCSSEGESDESSQTVEDMLLKDLGSSSLKRHGRQTEEEKLHEDVRSPPLKRLGRQTEEEKLHKDVRSPPLKRLRRGPTRDCRRS